MAYAILNFLANLALSCILGCLIMLAAYLVSVFLLGFAAGLVMVLTKLTPESQQADGFRNMCDLTDNFWLAALAPSYKPDLEKMSCKIETQPLFIQIAIGGAAVVTYLALVLLSAIPASIIMGLCATYNAAVGGLKTVAKAS